MKAYQRDLATIHDEGFGQIAQNGAHELLKQLSRNRIKPGRIIELGCGSGISSQILTDANYEVVGYDLSPQMIRIARKRVPSATFRTASFLDAPIPSCVAVTAFGEVLNYLFDKRNSATQLQRIIARVHTALSPGGMFIFDVATLERIQPGSVVRNFTETKNWACLYAATTNTRGDTLIRTISTYRKTDGQYRRDQEIHKLRLIDERLLTDMLRANNFIVTTSPGYGKLALPLGLVAFVAQRPRR